jgi:hypothetical protein
MDASSGFIEPQLSNHFYCYQEGSHYSWAECAGPGDHFNNNYKSRKAGDGLFALKFESQTESESQAPIPQSMYRYRPSFGEYDKFYTSSFDRSPLFDFSGYDQLEFFAQFVDQNGKALSYPEDLFLPTEISVKLYAPDGLTTYVSKSVLGESVNSPSFSGKQDEWVHFKVSIPNNLLKVAVLEISSLNDHNLLLIDNIYLTQKSGQPLICSGKDSPYGSSWLTSFDDGSTGFNVNAKEMCIAHYGENAWLGNEEEVSEQTASCCGNDPDEYYAGTSVNGYGCWNSRPIASGETTMNVEVEVASQQSNVTIEYPSQGMYVDLVAKGKAVQCPEDFVNEDNNEVECGQSQYCIGQNNKESCIGLNQDNKENDFSLNCTDTVLMVNGSEDLSEITSFTETSCFIEPQETKTANTTQILEDTQSISILNNTKLIYTINYSEDLQFQNGYKVESYELVSYKGDQSITLETFFFSPLLGYLGTKIDLAQLKSLKQVDVYLVADQVKVGDTTTQKIIQNISYPCSSDSCLIPLPGELPYVITNLHPDLYELYYLTDKDEKTLIEGTKTFNKKGNLVAEKVAQQIIYVNNQAQQTEEEFQYLDMGFYGCEAASFLQGNNMLKASNNLPYCSVKSSKFCAYSVTHQKAQERYTTINSWSDEALTQIGYEEIKDTDQNLSELYLNTKLQLKSPAQPIGPEMRNYSAKVLPTRNFITNAEFKVDALELPYWEIFDASGKHLVDNEKDRVKTQGVVNKVILYSGETLRSQRIAVPKNTNLSFSANASMKPIFLLVDKDGKLTQINETNFDTQTAAYLIVEFTGPGEVWQPYLQLVDKYGSGEYNYDSTYIERAGAACCLPNYCWNGYACVEEMTPFTALAEHVSEGRDYRCINGEWKATAPKWDWNQERWGFCQNEDECFVLGKTYGGKIENTAKDFYLGKYPVCINSSQYIFDNYCDAGNWTSRTKFLATRLIEVGQDNDYVLYCTDYKNALPELDNKENYLGGYANQQITEPSANLLSPAQPTLFTTCFTNILDPEGKRLIGDRENTCVNNVCVLKYKEGGDKVAFATSLNLNITDPNSFLIALNVPQEKLNEVCKSEGVTEKGKFIECDLSNLEISGDLWYSPELNAVVYGKQGISLQPSFIENTFNEFIGWFKELFGADSSLSDEIKFVSQAQNFREVYVSEQNNLKVRAVKEILSEKQKQTLVAEYEGYTTPICDYVGSLKVPAEMQSELLETLSDMQDYSCSVNGSVQTVEAVTGLDFLWPQLTGRLRVVE